MSFSHITDHIFVPLDQDLRVLLSVTQLLISVSLYSFEEIYHKVLLFFAKDSFLFFKLFHHLVLMGNPFKLLEFISKELEIGGSVVVFRGECLLFHVSVLDQLLRSVELLPRRNGI